MKTQRTRTAIGPQGTPLLALAAILLLAAACTAGDGALPPTESPMTSPTVNAPTAVASAASPSGSPDPSAADGAIRLSGNGPLDAGTYYLDNRSATNASRLAFTVPAGWTTEEYGELYKDRDTPGEVKFITWVLTHVFSDVCQWGPLVDVGTTVDELVAALMEQQGREASAPVHVTVGGFPATRIDLTVPPDLDTATCTNGVLRYWPAAGPVMSDGDCCAAPGSTDWVYVVDVAGNRLVVVARHQSGSSAANLAELQALVDSIEIEP